MSAALTKEFTALGAAIDAADRIVLAAHARPDGDAIGASLALGLCLRAAGKDIVVVNEDGVPESLAFLDPDNVLRRSADIDIAAATPFDLAIALDTATKPRLGAATLDVFAAARTLANVDHHISNPGYGDVNVIDPQAPATGQIVYEFLRHRSIALTPVARDALYVAISTDTGSFRYPATTARTYAIGAELLEAGVDVGRLNALTYENFPLRRLLVLRELLDAINLGADGRVASWSLTLDAKRRLATHPDDTENLSEHLRGIAGVIVAVFFEEMADGIVRVSMRSKSSSVDVSAICQSFGGGGHKLAAGARIEGALADVESMVLDRVHSEFNS